MPRRNTVEIIITAKDKSGRALSGVGDNLKSLGTVALGIGAAAAGAIAGVGAAIAKLAIDAAPLQGIEDAFRGLTDSLEGGSDAMLAALEDASAGMVSQTDLMQTFNQAAQLVSIDFAQRLPDAMSALGKVAAATGQDMDFLLSSLVTGVGRLSPMILDNLAIQVDLTSAYEDYAVSIGKTVDQLSKGEQQTALMNQVVQKLAENTANMPDVAGSAAAGIAQMGTMFKNVKDQIGKAFLPALSGVLETISELAGRWLPILTTFIESRVVPAIEKASRIFNDFLLFFEFGVEEGGLFEGALLAIQEVLTSLVPADQIEKVWALFDSIRTLKDQILEFLTPIIAWIEENVQLQDVLIGLGAAIATVVIPIIISLISTIAPIIATFAAVVLAVSLLRQAWETDFGGMRTKIIEFWENTVKPAFETLRAWLEVNIPIAIERLKTFWEEVLLPAIQTVWEWISGVLIPFFQDVVVPWLQEKIPAALAALGDFWETVLLPAIQTVWEWIQSILIPFFEEVIVPWLQEKIPEAIQILSDFWTNTLLPAINDVWAFIQEDLVPLFEALWELIEVAGALAIEILAGFWENVLQPALETVWEFIQDNVLPILEDLWKFIKDKLSPILEDAAGFFDDISGAVKKVIGWIKELTDKLKNVTLPDWAQRGSPAPIEITLTGMVKGLRSAVAELGRLDTILSPNIGLPSGMPLAFAGAGGQLGGPSIGTNIERLDFSVNTRATTRTAIQDYETLRTLIGAN